MRVLFFGLMLTATGWAQTELSLVASASTAAEPEFSSSRTIHVAPYIKPSPIVKSSPPVQKRTPGIRTWYLLAATSHGAAAFDAWTTRRNIDAGMVELNPLLKPFAKSNAIYPALQVGPSVTSYVSLRMMRSNRPLVRKLWWAPQVASTAISLTCGVLNTRRF